jgi:hypothetical protein
MTNLSPAAQAVMDAVHGQDAEPYPLIVAAALRAAADHLPDPQMSAHTLYAIADELDGGALTKPQPPVDGEVAELVARLKTIRNDYGVQHSADCRRAADLLERRYPQPIPVAERLPEANIKVLAHYFNSLGKGRTICAIWVPAKSRSEDHDLSDDDFTEYDEQDDKFYWPEGWYEAIENWDELGWVKVHEGEVAYWQPLPQWPAHALPLPSEEGAQ